jgi:glycosyltransferase involved in cell wall biosynthesis
MTSVDVVVPCYQYGRFLRDCVASVLRQGVNDLRVLIIDNASTDNSLEVARQLGAEDSRIEVRARQRNLGPHASWNEGIDWAKADYMVILAADDLLADGAIARAISMLDRHNNASFVMGRDASFRDGEAPPAVDRSRPASEWRIVPGHAFIEERCRKPDHDYFPGSIVVRTAIQKRAGHYREALPHTDDLEMLLRLAMLGDVAVTSAVQGLRREHGNNRTSHFWAERLPVFVGYEAAFDSFFAHEGASIQSARRLHGLASRRIAEFAYWCAMSRFAHGDLRVAFNLLKFALRRFPSMAAAPPFGWICRMENWRWRQLLEIMAKPGRRLAAFGGFDSGTGSRT